MKHHNKSKHCFVCRSESNEWIQVDFLEPKRLSGVLTQGSPDQDRWVEQFELYFSLDGRQFQPYTLYPGEQNAVTFNGNNDRDTPLRNLFNRDVVARVIRLVPLMSSASGSGLRFNVLGCEPNLPPQTQPTPAPTPGSGAAPSPGPTTETGTPGSPPQVALFRHFINTLLLFLVLPNAILIRSSLIIDKIELLQSLQLHQEYRTIQSKRISIHFISDSDPVLHFLSRTL